MSPRGLPTFSQEIILQIFNFIDQGQCRPRSSSWEDYLQRDTKFLSLLRVCRLWYNLAQTILYRRLRFQVTLGYGDSGHGINHFFRGDDEMKAHQKSKILLHTLIRNPSHLHHLQELHIIFPQITQTSDCKLFFEQPTLNDLERVLRLVPKSVQKIRIDGAYHLVHASSIAAQITRLRPQGLTLGGQWGDYLFADLLRATTGDNLRQLVLQGWSAQDFPYREILISQDSATGRQLRSMAFKDCNIYFSSQLLHNLFARPLSLKYAEFSTDRRWYWRDSSFAGFEHIETLLARQAASLDTIVFSHGKRFQRPLPKIPNFGLLPRLQSLTIDRVHLSSESPAMMNFKFYKSALQELVVIDPGEYGPTLVIASSLKDWLQSLALDRLEKQLTSHAYTLRLELDERLLDATTEPFFDADSSSNSPDWSQQAPPWPWHSAVALVPVLAEVNIKLTWTEQWPLVSCEAWNAMLLRNSGAGGWPERWEDFGCPQRRTAFDDLSLTDSLVSDGLNRCQFDDEWVSMWQDEKYKTCITSSSTSESAVDD